MPGQYFPIDWPKPTAPLEGALSQPRTTRYGGEHPGNYENTVLKRWREEEALEEERMWQEKMLEKELAAQEAAQETELASALAKARMDKELGMAQLGTQERMNTEQLAATQPQGPSSKEQAGTAYEFLRSLESPEDRQVFLQALKDKEGESGGYIEMGGKRMDVPGAGGGIYSELETQGLIDPNTGDIIGAARVEEEPAYDLMEVSNQIGEQINALMEEPLLQAMVAEGNMEQVRALVEQIVKRGTFGLSEEDAQKIYNFHMGMYGEEDTDTGEVVPKVKPEEETAPAQTEGLNVAEFPRPSEWPGIASRAISNVGPKDLSMGSPASVVESVRNKQEGTSEGIENAIANLRAETDKELIKSFQEHLKNQGLYKGAVNGEVNRATIVALRQYYPGHEEEFK